MNVKLEYANAAISYAQQVFKINGDKEGVRLMGVALDEINNQETKSSSDCPICGKDSPHYHSPEEATMYNAKFVGIGPQYIQDAIQEIYAAMDAMRRKGVRGNYDRGYNAGFNVSADILEAALKKVKEKLGFMADRNA